MEKGASVNSDGGVLGQSSSEKAVFFFFLALFTVSLVLAGRLIAPFFDTIVMALVVTGIFSSVNTLFLKRLKPSQASMITCVLIFFVVLVPVLLFVGVLSKEAYDL